MAEQNQGMNESELLADIEQKVEQYAKKYKPQLEQLSDSPLAKVCSIDESHIYGLGSQLEKWENYYNRYVKAFVPSHLTQGKSKNESGGSMNDLGTLPRLANDFIVANMGANPIGVFAGIQPIASSNGDVYVKTLLAGNSRGNTTQGQIVSSPLQAPDVYTDFWAGANNGEVTVATTANSSPSAGPYTITLTDKPVLKNKVKVYVSASIYGFDDGTGYIVGRGIEGTIDYTTGDVSLNFTVASGSIPTSTAIKLTYTSNLEESGAYAKVNLAIQRIPVVAEPFVVGQEFGLFQTWEIEQMFGRLAQEDSQKDLTEAMMAEICNKIINKMYKSAVAAGNSNLTEWSATPTGDVSQYLHRQSLPFSFAEAGKKLYQRTGRAVINCMIGDPGFCSYIETLDGFVPMNMVIQGAHIYGKYKDTVVIRAPQLPNNEALFIFTGTGMFDKPAVWGTYMPIIFLHPNIPVPNNVLRVQGAAVSYGAADLVIDRFITRFKITA